MKKVIVLLWILSSSLTPGAQLEPVRSGEYVEGLFKTGDTVPSELSRELWSSRMLEEERRGNAKSGYLVDWRYVPDGESSFFRGRLEGDLLRFKRVQIPAKYAYLFAELMKPVTGTVSVGPVVEEVVVQERRYRVPLEWILSQAELDQFNGAKYGEYTPNEPLRLTERQVQDLINLRGDLKQEVDWDTIEKDNVKHGSVGIYLIAEIGGDYSSLSAWEAGEVTGIMSSDCVAVVMGTWTAADTTSFSISGTTLTNGAKIRITMDSSAAATYLFNATHGNAIQIAETGVVIEKLNIRLSCPSDWVRIWIYNPDVNTDSPYIEIVKNNIEIVGGNETFGIHCESIAANATAVVANNFIYTTDEGYGSSSSSFVLADARIYVYNNTIVGDNRRGIYNRASSMALAINNLVTGTQDNYAGTFMSGSGYNWSGDADDPGTNGINTGDAWWNEVQFEDPSTNDWHLHADDIGATDLGTDLSSDTIYSVTDDIDEEERTGTWDIGADEFVSAEPPVSAPPIEGAVPLLDYIRRQRLLWLPIEESIRYWHVCLSLR